jgi:hypothetical protein
LTADAGRPISDRPPQVIFGLLVVACFGAFFITQRLKHTPTAVQRFEVSRSFTPGGTGRGGRERLSFKLAKADEVTVTIIDSAGNEIATLVRDRPVQRYKQFYLDWNGRRGEARSYEVLHSPHGLPILLAESPGPIAPAGEYRVEVTLRDQHKTVRSPQSFTLVMRL